MFRLEPDVLPADVPTVCVGGGSSLTLKHIRHIVRARLTGRCRVIAVNDAVFPLWNVADWLHGCDFKWWNWHREIAPKFDGIRTTLGEEVPKAWATRIFYNGTEGFESNALENGIRHGSNGGYQAMHMAVNCGARELILLGYDMHGQHWFGDHPKETTVDYSKAMLPKFNGLVEPFAELGVKVTNASPGTALKAFPLGDLEDVLECA